MTGRFRLAVDCALARHGDSTVVSGTVISGTVTAGDPVMVSPSGIAARVHAVRMQSRTSDTSRAGDRCALHLVGGALATQAICRGDTVLDAALHAPTERIDATLRVLSSESTALTQWMPVRLQHATAETGARVVLLDGGPVAPGAEHFIQLVLDRPIAAAVGDRFLLRDSGDRRIVGEGRLIDLRAPGRKRRTPERIAQLRAHALADPAEALAALLACAPGYVDFSAFARDRALTDAEQEAVASAAGLLCLATPEAKLGVSPANWSRFRRGLLEMLTEFHAGNPSVSGIGVEKLRQRLGPRLPASVFSAMLQHLARLKEIVLDGARVRLPGHEIHLPPQDEALWLKVRPFMAGAARFRPPRVRELAKLTLLAEPELRRAFKRLAAMDWVDEVVQDHFFLRSALAEMLEIAASLPTAAAEGRFSTAQFRDRLCNGRKVAIQILEFFDGRGITVRHGDLRCINREQLGLFLQPTGGMPICDMGPRLGVSGRASSAAGRPELEAGRRGELVLVGFGFHSFPSTHERGAP